MLSSKKARNAVALVLAAVIIVSGSAITFHLFSNPTKGTPPGKVTNLTTASNITANVMISPVSRVTLNGALVQIWPIDHITFNGPKVTTYSNVSPMVMFWVNSSWTATLKLPVSIYLVLSEWESYFKSNREGGTALVAQISYIANYSSTENLVYVDTEAIPYNPFTVNSTHEIALDLHPNLTRSPSFTIPADQTYTPASPIYYGTTETVPGTSHNQVVSPSVTPDGIPGGYYWAWYLYSTECFSNAQIPISFLNETSSGTTSNTIDSIAIGSTTYSTDFTMAKAYDYSSSESFDIGTNAVYQSGNVAGIQSVETYHSNKNLTLRDGVITINGNATILRYQWDYFNPLRQIIQKSDDYNTEMFINSLNESGGEFHLNNYWTGFENPGKYNQSSFNVLPLSKRYQESFGIYFNGTDSSALFGNSNEITAIGTALQPTQSLTWYTVYTSISATTHNSLGKDLNYLGIIIALVGVSLALAAVPWSDSITIPAILVSLAGFAVTVAAAFASGMLNVTANSFLYIGDIQNAGNSTSGGPIQIYNWYTPQDIYLNGVVYQFPTNYAIVKP